MTTKTRPVIKYPGAKWRIADWIISKMPQHKSYLEPFLGSGAVFFRKSPSKIETINDIDSKVFNLFSVIRDNAVELCRQIEMTPYSRQEYYAAFSDGGDDIERARKYLVQCWQGHGFRINYRSGWKNDISGRDKAYAVRYWAELPQWIMDIVSRLKQSQIENMQAVELITRFNSPEVLIYADPPYVLSTRKMKKQYSHEMTDQDHCELLETLLQHKGQAMISGYDNELYNSYLKGWDSYTTETTAEKGLARVEKLWIKGSAQMSLWG